jgi:hypothetical protein
MIHDTQSAVNIDQSGQLLCMKTYMKDKAY